MGEGPGGDPSGAVAAMPADFRNALEAADRGDLAAMTGPGTPWDTLTELMREVLEAAGGDIESLLQLYFKEVPDGALPDKAALETLVRRRRRWCCCDAAMRVLLADHGLAACQLRVSDARRPLRRPMR